MLCAQAWQPSSQHAGEKRGVAGLLLGRTERAARAAALVAQMVKNLPTKQKTQVPFLGQEYPLEKGMATHSSILAWQTTQGNRLSCRDQEGLRSYLRSLAQVEGTQSFLK